jgi:branched-chain amino acid aminotransferase
VKRQIWIDGEFVPWEEATIHVLSHCAQRGSLVFDYMSVHSTPWGVCVFRMPLHIERFLRSCELVGLPIAMGGEAIGDAIRAAVRANPGATAVKLSAYFASIEVGVVPLDNRVSVAAAAYDPDADIVRHKPVAPRPVPIGVRLWIEKEKHGRRDDIVPPQAKVAANYASPMMAKSRALDAGYDEILLVDEDGYVAEGPTNNIFLVDRQGTLLTPPEAHVLRGVRRQSIIELAEHNGIPVRLARVSPEELRQAAEAFLTGTNTGILPVSSVDGEQIGNGTTGPITTRLRQHFLHVTTGEDPAFADWLTPVDEA